jgi:hypothetical protein
MVIARVPLFCWCTDTAAVACNCMARTKDINNPAGFGHNPLRPCAATIKINRPQNMNQNHGNSGSSLPVCRSVHVVCVSEIIENNFATNRPNETWCDTHRPTSLRRVKLSLFLLCQRCRWDRYGPDTTTRVSCQIIKFQVLHQCLKSSSYSNKSTPC